MLLHPFETLRTIQIVDLGKERHEGAWSIVEKEYTKSGPWYALRRFYSGCVVNAVKSVVLCGGSEMLKVFGGNLVQNNVGEVVVDIAVNFMVYPLDTLCQVQMATGLGIWKSSQLVLSEVGWGGFYLGFLFLLQKILFCKFVYLNFLFPNLLTLGGFVRNLILGGKIKHVYI